MFTAMENINIASHVVQKHQVLGPKRNYVIIEYDPHETAGLSGKPTVREKLRQSYESAKTLIIRRANESPVGHFQESSDDAEIFWILQTQFPEIEQIMVPLSLKFGQLQRLAIKENLRVLTYVQVYDNVPDEGLLGGVSQRFENLRSLDLQTNLKTFKNIVSMLSDRLEYLFLVIDSRNDEQQTSGDWVLQNITDYDQLSTLELVTRKSDKGKHKIHYSAEMLLEVCSRCRGITYFVVTDHATSKPWLYEDSDSEVTGLTDDVIDEMTGMLGRWDFDLFVLSFSEGMDRLTHMAFATAIKNCPNMYSLELHADLNLTKFVEEMEKPQHAPTTQQKRLKTLLKIFERELSENQESKDLDRPSSELKKAEKRVENLKVDIANYKAQMHNPGHRLSGIMARDYFMDSESKATLADAHALVKRLCTTFPKLEYIFFGPRQLTRPFSDLVHYLCGTEGYEKGVIGEEHVHPLPKPADAPTTKV